MPKSVSGLSITIDIKLNGYPCEAIIDTGATATCVSGRLAEKVPGVPSDKPCMTLRYANGQTEVAQPIEYIIAVGPIKKKITTYIVKDGKYNLLLGTDWLQAMAACIDVTSRTVQIR